MKQYCYYQSPIGKLLLVGTDGVLEQLHFPNDVKSTLISDDDQCTEEIFQEVVKQLTQYFNGERQDFDLHIIPKGTDFQKQVWQELQKVPFGKTATYGQIAERIGNSKACRAVGGANNKNPIPIIIPCHRIIGRDGSLTGFGGGLGIKKQLLDLEGVSTSS